MVTPTTDMPDLFTPVNDLTGPNVTVNTWFPNLIRGHGSAAFNERVRCAADDDFIELLDVIVTKVDCIHQNSGSMRYIVATMSNPIESFIEFVKNKYCGIAPISLGGNCGNFVTAAMRSFYRCGLEISQEISSTTYIRNAALCDAQLPAQPFSDCSYTYAHNFRMSDDKKSLIADLRIRVADFPERSLDILRSSNPALYVRTAEMVMPGKAHPQFQEPADGYSAFDKLRNERMNSYLGSLAARNEHPDNYPPGLGVAYIIGILADVIDASLPLPKMTR